MYEVDLVWVCREWEDLSKQNSNISAKNWDLSPLLRLPLAEWWYGMVLHPYGHPPHIKHAKHLIYVWSGSGMSMKWMGSPKHILQHVPCEKPTQNPMTVLPLLVWWYGAISLEQPTTYKVCLTPFKCMKRIWYEYEVDEMSQSYPTACPKWETHTESYS